MKAAALLPVRLILFAFFQGMIAFGLHSWKASQAYWMLSAVFTNVASIIVLVILFRKEGEKYINLFRFSKATRKKDGFIFLALAILSVPLVLVPSLLLNQWLWGDGTYSEHILFQPLPVGMVCFLLLAFPVTIALSELPVYFGYAMPKLQQNFRSKWPAVLLPILFLSVQHCTLPVVPDAKFMLFRALAYFPFALMLGIALFKRPTLLPYFVIFHGLLDMMTVVTLMRSAIS